jgi:predicted phosphodiesterase
VKKAVDLFIAKSGNSIHAGDYIFPDILQEFEIRLVKDHHVRFIGTSGNNDEERDRFLRTFIDIWGEGLER